jgi:hypothetical protein
MCDVSNFTTVSAGFQNNQLQVCKYPDKTKRKLLKLSPKGHITPQAAMEPQGKHRHKAPQSLDAGWRKNFREGDDGGSADENSACISRIPRKPSAQRTGPSNTGSRSFHRANKRSGVELQESSAKKSKIAHAPLLGMF